MHLPASPHVRVLLVDDEPVIGSLLRCLLGARGHSIDVATSARDALNLISATPGGYDVVVLDEHLPDMRGSKAAVQIRAMAPNVPLVLATGDLGAVPDTANFDVVLEKPFSGVRMERAVVSALHCRDSAA